MSDGTRETLRITASVVGCGLEVLVGRRHRRSTLDDLDVLLLEVLDGLVADDAVARVQEVRLLHGRYA